MSLGQVYGHEKQKEILRTAIRRDRIPHAFLFYGTTGIGKRTAALELAKALNCAQGGELLDACDACVSCRKVDHRNHPDVQTIEADGQFIRIAAVDELQDRMKFRPSEGRKRVFVLDEADRLNITAANALLKTLEEPPPATVLILITARPHQLPATILSRCQHVRFNPLSKEEIARFLVEREGLAADAADVIAAGAGGSIARAIAMNKEDFLALREEVMAGLAPGWRDKPLALLAFLAAWRGNRKDIDTRLDVLRSCFRDALIYGETGEEGTLINRDRTDLIAAMSRRLSGPVLLDCLAAIDSAGRALETNANRALTLEVMAFKLAAVW